MARKFGKKVIPKIRKVKLNPLPRREKINSEMEGIRKKNRNFNPVKNFSNQSSNCLGVEPKKGRMKWETLTGLTKVGKEVSLSSW